MILKDKVYLVVAGGYDEYRWMGALDSVEILDPTSKKGWVFGKYIQILHISSFNQFLIQSCTLILKTLISIFYFLGLQDSTLLFLFSSSKLPNSIQYLARSFKLYLFYSQIDVENENNEKFCRCPCGDWLE